MSDTSARYSPLLIILSVLTAGIGCYIATPAQSSQSLPLFAFKFYLWSAFLLAALWGLGGFIRVKCLASDRWEFDPVIGFGALALFLAVYLKITISPYLPLALLVFGFMRAMKALHNSGQALLAEAKKPSEILIALIVVLCTISLSFNPISNGFLYFPQDFDSDLFHLTFPEQVVAQGHYLTPYWLRVPWYPRLTHHWYMLVLSLFDLNYVKAINVVVWAQIALLFVTLPKGRGRATGALALALLSGTPEFYKNIHNTSLDAVLAMFVVSAFVLFCRSVKEPKWSDVVLLTVLCGFASGQKHFGMMFSAPLLGIMVSRLFLNEYRKKPELGVRAVLRAALAGCALLGLYVAIFVPFYAHNWIEGTSLLFPFSGNGANRYGWEAVDLDVLMKGEMPKWGHAKSLAGFFMLPVHLLQYPDAYQFGRLGNPYDWAMSLVLALCFVSLPALLLFKNTRKPFYLLPLLILIAHVGLWYRGMQVIRYLFPPLICGFFLLPHLASLRAVSGKGSSRLTVFIPIALALIVVWYPVFADRLPVAVTKPERENWLKTYVTKRIAAYQYLREMEQTVD